VPAQDVAFAVAPVVAPVVAPAPTVAAADAQPRPGRASAEAARGFWVQLGAFRERDGAETFRRRVGADGESSWLEPLLAIVGDASLYRVQAGPYPSRDEADAVAQRARSALGVVPIVVERR
jgi:rare lipoprotein A